MPAWLHNLREFDWSELRYPSVCGYWPTAVYVMVCVGSILLVALLAGLALAPGLNESWQNAQARAAVLVDEHSTLGAQLLTRRATNISTAWLSAPAVRVRHRLLTNESMPMAVDRLRDAAAARGLAVSVLQPQRKWQQQSLQAYEIVLHVEADSRQLARFLDDIRTLPLALTIRQADWQLASSKARLTLFLLTAGENKTSVGDVRLTDQVGAVTAAQGPAANSDWQRVAYIRRGDRYVEVLRNADGVTRKRDGNIREDGR